MDINRGHFPPLLCHLELANMFSHGTTTPPTIPRSSTLSPQLISSPAKKSPPPRSRPTYKDSSTSPTPSLLQQYEDCFQDAMLKWPMEPLNKPISIVEKPALSMRNQMRWSILAARSPSLKPRKEKPKALAGKRHGSPLKKVSYILTLREN